MVQTLFTWRYGGHQVFLYGSFNGWSERIPMMLVEGSETIFQQIVDLPPRCYQFRFLVDDVWKIDPQQVFNTDEYGTLIIVVGTEIMPPHFAAEARTRGVSHPVLPTVASSSVGSIDEPLIQIPDGEMVVLRQVLSMHLLSSTTYDLIPVIALDVDLDVEKAFHVLHELGLSVVPLWDENDGQLAGMLTAFDLSHLHINHNAFTNKELERRTISSWKRWKVQHQRDININLVPFQRSPVIHAGPDDTLGVVTSRILQNNISAVPIIHSENGSCPRLLHIVCLAGILGSVHRHLQHHIGYLPLLQQPVGYLPVGTWSSEVRRTSGPQLLMLRPTDSLTSALTMLLEAQISAVPVVDDGGSMIDLYSRSDITSLANEYIYTRIKLNHMTISHSLEVTGGTGRSRYQICTKLDTFYRVMELLSNPDVRRVIVVEASSRRVEGIITLRDVFSFFWR